jgi:hypothetical protein
VSPISRRNEIGALTTLAVACESRLQQFPTSVEDDNAVLADAALGRKLRNIVMIRRHEKVTRRYLFELTQTALPILHDGLPILVHMPQAGSDTPITSPIWHAAWRVATQILQNRVCVS